jgi:hypothetical protein
MGLKGRQDNLSLKYEFLEFEEDTSFVVKIWHGTTKLVSFYELSFLILFVNWLIMEDLFSKINVVSSFNQYPFFYTVQNALENLDSGNFHIATNL